MIDRNYRLCLEFNGGKVGVVVGEVLLKRRFGFIVDRVVGMSMSSISNEAV